MGTKRRTFGTYRGRTPGTSWGRLGTSHFLQGSEGGDNEWQFVLCGEDSDPSDVAFSGSPGMRNDIDTSQWTLRDYILHFMPDTLIEKLTNWTNSCILVKKAEQFCMETTENVPPTKEVSFDEMKTICLV